MADDNSSLILIISFLCICFILTQFILLYDIYISYNILKNSTTKAPSII